MVEPSLDYVRLLARVDEVTEDVRRHSLLRGDLDSAGVAIHERAGTARFVDPHAVESDNAPRLVADKVSSVPAEPRGGCRFLASI